MPEYPTQSTQESEVYLPGSRSFLHENFREDGERSKAFWDEHGIATIEKAYQYSEMGKFQIFLLMVCLIGYSAVSTVPYILLTYSNAIQCDYQLIMEDKRTINDVVYVCMILGGVVWSLLADTLSRKWALVCALFVYSCATCGLSLATTFLVFGFCRGMGAFSLSAIQSIIITYISEFQVRIFRGSMICCLQLASVLGMVIIPTIPVTWRKQVWLGAIPPLLAMVGFLFLPDSPRFYFSRGRKTAALNTFRYIHSINTGNRNLADFPIRGLKDNKSVAEMKRAIMKEYIPAYLEPKFVCIPLLMFSQFAMMFSYYTLMMWFPQMVPKQDAFFPLRRIEDIPQDCKLGFYGNKYFQPSTLASAAKYMNENSSFGSPPLRTLYENPCDRDKGTINLKSSTMDALTCMPSLIWVVVKIDSIGRLFFITFSHVVAGCLAFASYFMHSPSKGLLFACLFDSVTMLSVTTAHCLAVELFPTRIRVLGVALVIGAGQLGTVVADIGGAISLGFSCVVTVALLALLLAISGMLMLTLPDTTGIWLR